MSFRVTQCPACESTFNTSPALLESAAGKVRCGACLTVFEAAENFLETELDGNEGEPESVFLSQSPQGYFDPSRFLTRASLQESLNEDLSEDLNEAFDGPPVETLNDNFDDTDELHPVPSAPNDEPGHLAQASQFDSQLSAESQPVEPLTPGDEDSEFMALVAAGLPDDAAQPESEATADAFDAVMYSAPEPDITVREIPEPESTTLSDAPTPPAPADEESGPVRSSAHQSDQYPEQDDEDDAAMAEYAYWSGMQDQESIPAEPDTAETEPAPAAPPPAQETLQAQTTRPEAFSLHVNFSVQTTPFAADQRFVAEPEENPAAAEEEPSDTLEDAFNAVLEEEEFQNSLSDDSATVSDIQPDVELPDALPESSDQSAPEAEQWLTPDSESADNAAQDAEQEFVAALDNDLVSEQQDAETERASSLAEEENRAESDAATPAVPEPETTPEAELIDQSVEAIRARALKSELRDEDALEAIPEENLKALGEFSTPVEIVEGQRRKMGRRLAWTAVALIAALGLGGQYLWQQIDRYSQVASVRPLYELGCHYLGCELPVYNNIDAIQSNNLSVRSHPTVPGALSVNVEFRNTAAFPQRFPVMILSFNSATNSVIALREFSPGEYLPEALRNRRLMPSRSPIQIALEIMDPGDDAVNYTLAFRRP